MLLAHLPLFNYIFSLKKKETIKTLILHDAVFSNTLVNSIDIELLLKMNLF